MRSLDPPGCAVLLDARDARAGAHLEVVPFDVAAEVLDQVVARDPAAEVPRDAHPGQAGEQARRVEPQPVVALPPRRAGLGACLEHERVEAAFSEQGGSGEAG